MQTVFSNHMTAHVWAQLAQNEGRSNNGQFYFDGPTLYSYGAHFVAGYIVPTAPNGDAPTRALSTFINGDSYSVTTGRHLSHAHGAATGAAYAIPGLTELQREIHAHVWPSAYPCESGPQGFRRPAPMKARREALPAIRRHFAAQPAAPSAMAALLRGMGATGAESARWALMAERAHAKAEKERAARELARDRAAAAKDARALAARPVSDTRDKMRADMDSTWFRAERAESEWRDTGRRMFRAKKKRHCAGAGQKLPPHVRATAKQSLRRFPSSGRARYTTPAGQLWRIMRARYAPPILPGPPIVPPIGKRPGPPLALLNLNGLRPAPGLWATPTPGRILWPYLAA